MSSSPQRERTPHVVALLAGGGLMLLFTLSVQWTAESPAQHTHARAASIAADNSVEQTISRAAIAPAIGQRRVTEQKPSLNQALLLQAVALETPEPTPDAGYVEPSTQRLERASLQEVADRFANEQPDDDATRSFSAEVAGALADLSIAGAIEQLSCRDTVCGARLRFASLDEALRLEADGSDPSRVKWLSVVDDQPGLLLVDVYWPRATHER